MLAPRHDFFLTLNRARKATRAGDVAGAERWTRLAERRLAIAQKFDALCARRREEAAARTAGPAKPAGPVMLDPKGFSPGGTPNWYLNMKRRERAGLE